MADAHLSFPSFFLCSMKKGCFFLLNKKCVRHNKTDPISTWYNNYQIHVDHMWKSFALVQNQQTNIQYGQFPSNAYHDMHIMHIKWKTYFSASTPKGHLGCSPEISLKTEHGYTFPIEQQSIQVFCVQCNKVLSVAKTRKDDETGVKSMN